ncbi:MAG: hypothetical protein AAFS11_10330, partial [Planctomycetota bacterium]
MRACGMKCVAMAGGVLVSAGAVLSASGQAVDVTLISEAGQAAPGLGSEWDWFLAPRVNGSGQMLYRAGLADGRSGLFVSLDGETFESVMEIGDPQPGTGAYDFESVSYWAIDRDGGVTFLEHTDVSEYSRVEGVWHRLPGGDPELLARGGQSAHDSTRFDYDDFRPLPSIQFARRTIVCGWYDGPWGW